MPENGLFRNSRPEVVTGPPNRQTPPMFTHDELARLLNITRRTLHKWIAKGIVPSPTRFGYTTRYTAEAVAAILAGPKEPGRHIPSTSPRALVGKKGGRAAAKARSAKAHVALSRKPTGIATPKSGGDRQRKLVKARTKK